MTKRGAVEFRITTVAGVLHFSADVNVSVEAPSKKPLAQAADKSNLDSLRRLMSPVNAVNPKSIRAMKDIRIAAAGTGSTRSTTSSMTITPIAQAKLVPIAIPSAIRSVRGCGWCRWLKPR